MARKRTIDPDSWTDSKLAELSIGAHLLWVGLVSLADDEGVVEWNAVQFKGRLFSLKAEATIDTISAWMDEVSTPIRGAARGAIAVFEANGNIYAYHPAWKQHQYVSKPAQSKMPPPPLPGEAGHFLSTKAAQFRENPNKSAQIRTNPGKVLASVSVSDTVYGLETGNGIAAEAARGVQGGTTPPPPPLPEPIVDLSDLDDEPEPDQRRYLAPVVPISPVLDFCRFFVAEGVAAGAIDAHHAPTPLDYAGRFNGHQQASTLLNAYGPEECRQRAKRLFAAVNAGKNKRNPSIETLSNCWAKPDIEGIAAPVPVAVDRTYGNPSAITMAARFAQWEREDREKAAQTA